MDRSGLRARGAEGLDPSALGRLRWSVPHNGECVRKFWRDSQGSRQRGIHLHDEQAFRVASRAVQLVDQGSRVKR